MPSIQTVTKKLPQSAVFKYLGDGEDYLCDQGIIPAGAQSNGSPTFDIGTVLGRITSGAITVAAAVAGSGNTGNGTCALGAPGYDDQVQAGEYHLFALSATEFEVSDPAGRLVDVAKTGAAFSKQIAFTLIAGETAFAPGDEFTIAVSAVAGSGKFVPINPAAGDGSQNFAGLVYRGVTVSASKDTPCTIATRGPMIVVSDNLVWPSGISAAAQAAALAQAASVGIKAQPFG